MAIPKIAPELPTAKTLPYYVIVALITAIAIMWNDRSKRDFQCKAEREKWAESLEKEREQNRKDAREASQELTKYLLRQDSINYVNLREIQKLRKR